MFRLLGRDPARFFASASLASFGVLGWLLVQWVTVGVAEHAHLGHHAVEAHHHHPYAGPLAVVMMVTALCSLLGVFASRLHRGPAMPEGRGRSRPLLVPAAMAAGLFVLVESYELQALGREHDSSAMTFLMVGATLQLVVLPVSWALNRRAVAGLQRCADRLRTPRDISVPGRTVQRCGAPLQVPKTAFVGVQRVRGPPPKHCFYILLLTAKPAPV